MSPLQLSRPIRQILEHSATLALSCVDSKIAGFVSTTDRLRLSIWAAAALLMVTARIRSGDIVAALSADAPPFLILAAVILLGLLADQLGLIRLLSRLIVPAHASPRRLALGVLCLTGLLSGLVNIDVAVVIAIPMASARTRGGLMAEAIALTANSASFLLPSSNVTTLLVLSRTPLSPTGFIEMSWLAWTVVLILTVSCLSFLLRPGAESLNAPREANLLALLADLLPLYLAASAIRGMLVHGLGLGGSFVTQFLFASVLAAALDNLPAASVIHAHGVAGHWAAILGLAMGPNLLVTGSLATVLCRRLALDRGAGFSAWRFSALGLFLLPIQALTAASFLHVAGTAA